MKRMYLTVLVAVFLSVTLAGCYTKLKGPEPGTGVEQHYSNDYPYYYDDYYNPLYFQHGWYNPYYFGSPSYFGNFYYPWWYDPYYYDGGYYHGGTVPEGKDIRRRRGGNSGTLPSIPGGGYTTPSQPSSPSGQSTEPAPSNPSKPSGNTGSSGEKDNSSGGKTTRGRR